MTDHGEPQQHRPQPGTDRGAHPDRRAHVSIHSPVDLVSVVPYLLEYRPGRGDLVTVFTAQGFIVCAAVLPVSDHHTLTSAWDALTAGMSRTAPQIDSQYLIAFLDPDAAPALRRFALDATPAPTEVLHVHAGLVSSLTCRAPGVCCPGEAVAVRSEAAFAAPFAALQGVGTLPDRAGLGDCLSAGPPALLEQVSAHLEDLIHATSPADHTPQMTTAAAGFALLTGEHTARHTRPRPLDPRLAARLLVALGTTSVRDSCVPWHDDAAWWLWLELIRHAPPGWVAPVATLIATTAYQQGRGAQARIAAEHALHDQPDYSLAATLLEILRRKIHPRTFIRTIDRARTDGHLLSEPSAHEPGPGPG